MKSIKLVGTIGDRLKQKYGELAWHEILNALDGLVQADELRGLTTKVVCLDDASDTELYDVSPIEGKVTAVKCKRVIDKLCQKLSPDYIVLLGAGDVIPYFEVPNPSYRPTLGDEDQYVPTDNPYACSRPFLSNNRKSFLIPDRVLGRVPDLPGGNKDVRWMLDYLEVARTWTTKTTSDYGEDLIVCCHSWRKSGAAVVSYLSRASGALLVAPPTLYSNSDKPPVLTDSYSSVLHVIKCHGAPFDTMFYGQKGGDYPPVMTSNSLSGKTINATVVGAMCCYGAAVFDPDDPRVTNEKSGDVPIPSIYLRQGAYAFMGSTTIAWVGDNAMMCADWIVASFIRYVLQGASTGRALLDAKQEFLRWINQQGRNPDFAEEKTFMQFHLLGDPSIHPITPTGETAALSEAHGVIASAAASLGFERRRRRAFRHAMGMELRKSLPSRELVENVNDVSEAVKIARNIGFAGFEGFNVDDEPLVHRVVSTVPTAEPPVDAVAASVIHPESLVTESFAGQETFQYYWTARRPNDRILDARMVKIETDRDGAVIRTQVLVTA